MRATFFLIGVNAVAHPELVRSLAGAGMEVGSHPMLHPPLAGRPLAEQVHEIVTGARAVADAAGRPIALFRPVRLVRRDDA